MGRVFGLRIFTAHRSGPWLTGVGGNRPPRTPMGTEPLLGSAGGGGCAKSGSRRHTQTILPSFGPHGCVKPYCCLSDCIGFLLESTGCYSKLGAGRGWMSSGFLFLSTCAWASFYMHKGLPIGGSADEGKNGKELCVQWLHSAIAPNSDGRGQGH